MSEKLLSQAIAERRATPGFQPTAVPDADLKKILQAGIEAPSGNNTQPWRFVVVRDSGQRKRLRGAAMGQAKVEEAPVVIVACGDLQGTLASVDETLRIAEQYGFSDPEGKRAAGIKQFVNGTPGDAAGKAPDNGVWLNRQVMIGFTSIMWMAEVLGYDTAPMEGFVESQVREVLGIPPHVRVVAMLAIGKLKGEDKKYSGRLPMSRICFEDKWGEGLEL